MKKSLLLTMALMLFVLFNLSAQIKKVDDNINPSEATITLGGVTVEGNVRAEIFDDADMQIYRYIGGVWQNQYYGTASKSTRLYIDGNAYTGNGGYYRNFSSTSMTNVSNTLLDANTAENVLETSGQARIVQTTFLPPDATFLTYKYEITNLSGATWSDARFFHGGDTYLWHSDNGAGFWDAEENIIGVNKISGGIVQQTIYVQGLQPAYAYESALWWDVRNHVRSDALTNYVNAAENTDNALAMEWRTSGIAPGETWTLEVIEKFGTKDITNLEVTGPIMAGVETNNYTDLSFTLTNGNGSAVDAALSVSVDDASWSASILSPTSPVNVAAGASQEIIVRLNCPAGAIINDIANATLQATAGSENATFTTTAIVTVLPSFTTQPMDVTVCNANEASSFSITGTNISVYKWQEYTTSWSTITDGGVYSGATTGTLNISNSSGLVGNQYRCVITSLNGSNYSDEVSIIQGNTTAITTQPVGSTLCFGDPDAVLSVVANGTNLTYQWQLNGSDITGANASSYDVASIYSNAGNYTCIVTGDCGSITSDEATIIVNTPTTIDSQPVGATVCQGDPDVTFAVAASGTNLSYQWQFNGTDISGATTNSHTVASEFVNAGSYTCIVTGDCGLVTSDPATLTVNTLTAITTQPVGSTMCFGDPDAVLSVVANGTNLTYQWQLNGSDITGANASSYDVASLYSNAGNYTCIITGDCGSITSDVATIIVNTPTTIDSQPVGATVCQGDPDVTFAVAASGTNLSYQWQFNGTDISGATTNSHTVASEFVNAGSYTCIVTGDCGSVTSDPATLTVNTITAITTQPVGSTMCFGDPDAVLSVVANGTNLTYQWQLNGSDITGANASSYDVASIYSNAGNYTCIVTGDCGSITSDEATIIVNTPTTIDSQPVGATVCQGDPDVTFAVAASGTNLSYQWQFNGTDISGATTNSHTVASEFVNAGSYTCIVTGDCGSVTSDPATLTVNTLTAITTQPVGSTMCFGDPDAVLSVVANGTNLTYQWQLNGSDITGANTSSYSVASVYSNAGNYTCIVTGECGIMTTDAASIIVNIPTTIDTQPLGATVCRSDPDVTFALTASGTGITYQWQFNGTDISGATTNNYTVTSEFANAGTYTCIVTGDCGSVTSDPAILTVNAITAITTHPAGATLCFGDPDAVLSVVANGTNLTYQWQLNGSDITGANTSSYSVASVYSNAGNYTCIVTGECGIMTTDAASIIVNIPTTIDTQPLGATVCRSDPDVTFALTASGTGITYQWQFNGTDISGATTNNYTVTSEFANAGTYTCIVTGDCGSVTSDPAILTVNAITAITTHPAGATLCFGDPDAVLSVVANGTNLTYQWQLNGVAISGATNSTYSVVADDANAGNYDCIVNGVCGVEVSNAAVIIVNPIYNETDEATICDDESFVFGSQTLTESGIYTEVFSSILGCDSTVVLTLTVNPTYNETDLKEICEGDAYIFGTQTLSEGGVYTEIFPTINGCDSTVILTLTVNPVYNETVEVSVCEGEEYIFGTQTLTEAGIYSEMFTSVSGCDSTVILTFNVYPVYNETDAVSICEGNVYEFGTQSLTESGVYTELFTSISGCDSIVVLTLTVLSEYFVEVEASICEGGSYVLGTQTLTETGVYSEVFVSTLGCDSTVTLSLEVLAAFNVTDEASICEGDEYVFGTQTLTVSGVYVEVFNPQIGCDSTVTLTLTVNPVYNESDIAEICDGDIFVFGSQVLTTSGVYTEMFSSISECDSTVTLTLMVNPVYDLTQSAEICDGEEYIFGTQTLTESGEYSELFMTTAGCDSLVTLTLNVNPVYNEVDAAIICEGDEYIFGTQTITEAGVYTELFSSSSGCDSTVVLTVTVNPIYNETDAATICEGDEYIFGTQTLTAAGDYTEVFSSILGCDSTVVLTLNVNPVFNETYEAEICEGDAYVFGMQTLTEAGIYTEVFNTILGCDSTVTLTLIVNPVYDVTAEAAICEGGYYDFGTQTLTETGVYTELFTSISGCDSTVTLSLTVNDVFNVEDEATICEGEEYIFGTQVLTEPGVYTELFNPQVGCDSTVVLTLYVNPTFNETDEATICEGDEYIFGTQTLTEGGVFTEVFATVLGCDSTVVLTLTVNPVYEETDEAVICEGDEYIFGTQTLTETGVYTEVFATVLGCDSTVVLTLTVNPVYDETDEAVICEGDEFIFGTQVLTVSGVYTEVFTSISGCDSTVVLSLTVDPIAIASYTYEQELSVVTFTNTSMYGESYLWDFGDGNTSTEENPVHDFINNGIYTVILAVTNPCGTKYYQEDIQITGVGIQQVKFTNIKIYPNPASSFVTIKGIDCYEVDIYDVIGNLMLSTSDKEIDVSNIPRGTYFVIVKDTNGVLLKTEKLIIH